MFDLAGSLLTQAVAVVVLFGAVYAFVVVVLTIIRIAPPKGN